MPRNNPWKTPTLTKESFGESVNINSLAARALGGQLIPTNILPPQYGDHTRHQDLQSSLDFVQYHKEQFAALPPNIRSEMRNDPVCLLEFLESVKADEPGARARGITIGLVEPSEPEARYIKAVNNQARIDQLESELPPEPPAPPPTPKV